VFTQSALVALTHLASVSPTAGRRQLEEPVEQPTLSHVAGAAVGAAVVGAASHSATQAATPSGDRPHDAHPLPAQSAHIVHVLSTALTVPSKAQKPLPDGHRPAAAPVGFEQYAHARPVTGVLKQAAPWQQVSSSGWHPAPVKPATS
jgi:hypothetical protein